MIYRALILTRHIYTIQNKKIASLEGAKNVLQKKYCFTFRWNLTVKYNLGQETWGEREVIDYWNTKEYGNVYLPQNKGTWYLSSYVFFIRIGDIQWYIKGADLSKLSGIPQSFTIE